MPKEVKQKEGKKEKYNEEKVEKAKEPKQLSEEMEKVRKKKFALAEKFKEEVLKRYQKYIKSVVLFGSLVRGDFTEKSDIDMLVVIDDVTTRFTPEMKDRFDDELRETARQLSEDMVVQPAWTLSEFWDMARIGHPLLYTIVRDGWALYDTGFFVPVRKLLELGKIPTTLEAVEKFMEASPQKISRVQSAKLYMVAEDLYYAMLNSSQAVLMYLGENPPTPKETVRAVKEHLVDPKLLEEVYLNDINSVIEFRKGVEHKEVKEISGQQLDDFIDKAKRYVDRMEQLIKHLQERRKQTMVEKNYEVMIKASVAALKKMEKLPPDPKDLPTAVKQYLIDQNKIDPYFMDVFKRVIGMRKALDEDKVKEIPQRDIELMREYVRRFVRDVGMILEEPKTKSKAAKVAKQEKQKPTKKVK